MLDLEIGFLQAITHLHPFRPILPTMGSSNRGLLRLLDN